MSVVFIETPRNVGSNRPYTGSKASSGKGTKLTLDSGEEIPEVKSVDVHIAYDKAITADIRLHAAFKGQALAKFFVKHPTTGEDKEVKTITFVDGGIWNA